MHIKHILSPQSDQSQAEIKAVEVEPGGSTLVTSVHTVLTHSIHLPLTQSGSLRLYYIFQNVSQPRPGF
jgi:hypothetical protein